MITPLNNDVLNSGMSKDTSFETQIQRFCQYLKTRTATVTMVSKAIKLPEKNLTRAKRFLEKRGLLRVVKIEKCKITGFKAAYLTCNPEMFPFDPQTNLFQSEGGQDVS
jgi:hypothetical protein